MEKQSSSRMLCNAIVASAGALALMFASGHLYAKSTRLHIMPRQQTPSSIYPNPIQGQASASDTVTSPPNYQDSRPQPLMHGEGFNYDLYYNYRLTPHIILRPNLQQTTKPGSVEDNSQRFVGGLSAGIKF